MAKSLSPQSFDGLESWNADWSGLRVLVIGLGETGFALVDTLLELGCQVEVLADEALPERRALAEIIGARVFLSTDSGTELPLAESMPDLVVTSPGIESHCPTVRQAHGLGLEVWSDLEVAWRTRDKMGPAADWIMILESPESKLILEISQEIISRAGQLSRVVGFEAPPLLDALRDPNPYECLQIAVKASSLVWRQRFPISPISPLVTVSVSDENTDSGGVFFDGTSLACVYKKNTGHSEKEVRLAEVNPGARAIGLGLDSPAMSDFGIVEGILVDRAFLDNRANEALEIVTIEELTKFGWTIPEDLPTILAAVAIARSREVSPAIIAEILANPRDSWIDKNLNGAP